jgi:energy-coupling factor transport system ATP-binding protein
VDLAIREGEFVILAGPSGGGKSTLLRAMCGLVPHFHGGTVRGRVLLCGKDTRETDTAELFGTFGMVFQDPETQMVMTDAGNDVAFGLRNLGWPEKKVRRRVREVARLTGVGHLLHRFVPSLSGGERQRLAIASAMAPGPKVLLLDEPTSQLDPGASGDILGLVGKLHREQGLTVVMAEHRLERCLGMADRLLVVEDGCIVYDGDPDRQRVAPLNRATADAAPCGRSRPGGAGVAPVLRRRPVLRCRDVSYSYDGGPAVVDHASLDVLPGEILAVMGPNGAGKTTLAKMLNGLIRPAAGRVEVDGKDVSGLTPAQLSGTVGFLSQDVGGYLTKGSVREELEYTLELQGVPVAGREERVRRALKGTGITRWKDEDPRALSCGGRHLAALASVLVAGPRVLVLDEPTRGIDPGLKEQLVTTLRRLAAKGTAVVLVTQDPRFARSVAGRRVVMKGGKLSRSGSPGDAVGPDTALSGATAGGGVGGEGGEGREGREGRDDAGERPDHVRGGEACAG